MSSLRVVHSIDSAEIIKYSNLRVLPLILRVLPLIFDQILSAQFLKTDNVRTNRTFWLKQLAPKVHDDSIWDDIAPSSGGNELIKLKISNTIYFCYSYLILMIIPLLDCKFKSLSEIGFQSKFYQLIIPARGRDVIW